VDEPRLDPRFNLLFEIAKEYLNYGVGGTYDFSDKALDERVSGVESSGSGLTLTDLRSAVDWLETTYLIMAIGPKQYKISPIGIDYVRDPKSRDPKLPQIPEEFGSALLMELEKYNAISKQLHDEARLNNSIEIIIREIPPNDHRDVNA